MITQGLRALLRICEQYQQGKSNSMNPEIESLSKNLHELHKQIMITVPWSEGYADIVAIHDYLLRTMRDHAHKDFQEFQSYLANAAEEIEKTWTSKSSLLSSWSSTLKPVLEGVERVIGAALPLIALL